MKAIGYFEAGSIDRENSLQDNDIPEPSMKSNDLLVRVSAVSVNPVDAKVRLNRQPQGGAFEVLGWDAVGVVQAIGAEAQGFSVGDRVYYAGAINRPGSNAELQAVDARLVGKAPLTLGDADTAALPLTAITAWELLFERLGAHEGEGEGRTLLIIGAAGGVGSLLIQLARKLTKLQIIATASRTDSQEWCRSMGAHAVIDHHQPMLAQLQALGIEQVELVASLTHTDKHWRQIIEMAAPQGRVGLIDDPAEPLDVMMLKRKSLSLHWELMFTRSLFQTKDMYRQGQLLSRVAQLVDEQVLRSSASLVLSPINAHNLRQAHKQIESQSTIGKTVLAGGFESKSGRA